MQRTWIAVGALAGLGAVAMAALTAHAFGGPDAAARATVRSDVEMQIWHALALLACGLWAPRGGRLADAAGAAFTLGILLFCGGVYAVGVFGLPLGTVAAMGGSLLMAGWALLGLSAVRATRNGHTT